MTILTTSINNLIDVIIERFTIIPPADPVEDPTNPDPVDPGSGTQTYTRTDISELALNGTGGLSVGEFLAMREEANREMEHFVTPPQVITVNLHLNDDAILDTVTLALNNGNYEVINAVLGAVDSQGGG
jgi:hypothetical protein